MGIKFEIDVKEGIIYSIAEGTVGPEEIQAYRKELRADPNLRPDLAEIVEYRLASFGITDEELNTLASTFPMGLSRKLAFVISDGPNKEFALRYKERVKEKILVEVFTDLGSAKKWVTSD